MKERKLKLTSSSSALVKNRGRMNLLKGAIITNMKGKAREAAEDFTTHITTSINTCNMVYAWIFRVFTWCGVG